MKPVKYFVSYSFPKGNGNIEITLSTPITTHKQIMDIQEWIEKEYDLGVCIVLFYSRLS